MSDQFLDGVVRNSKFLQKLPLIKQLTTSAHWRTAAQILQVYILSYQYLQGYAIVDKFLQSYIIADRFLQGYNTQHS